MHEQITHISKCIKTQTLKIKTKERGSRRSGRREPSEGALEAQRPKAEPHEHKRTAWAPTGSGARAVEPRPSGRAEPKRACGPCGAAERRGALSGRTWPGRDAWEGSTGRWAEPSGRGGDGGGAPVRAQRAVAQGAEPGAAPWEPWPEASSRREGNRGEREVRRMGESKDHHLGARAWERSAWKDGRHAKPKKYRTAPPQSSA